jgi:hypothetical protein
MFDVTDVVDRDDLSQDLALGRTFDYGPSQYATGDVDDPNLPNMLSKTFDMGVKPVVIPVLDFNKLKQVKAYKDWYGYAQKLEKSVKLLRTKIKKLEVDRLESISKYTRMKTQNHNLYLLNEKLNQTIKKLNEKVKESSTWKKRFENTMPNMGPNYVSFTMMDMHKTINNQKSSIMNLQGDQMDGLDHSFNNSDPENPTNLNKEINQFSQNSSTKDKGSSGRNYSHKKSQSMQKKLIKNKSHNIDLYDINESPNFLKPSKNMAKINEDIKVAKVQIKNPCDLGKYVQRSKKRGHARNKTHLLSPSKVVQPFSLGPKQPNVKRSIQELMYNTADAKFK